MTAYKFEVVIDYFEDHDKPTENDLELGALYYGDKHQAYGLFVVPGTVEELGK